MWRLVGCFIATDIMPPALLAFISAASCRRGSVPFFAKLRSDLQTNLPVQSMGSHLNDPDHEAYCDAGHEDTRTDLCGAERP